MTYIVNLSSIHTLKPIMTAGVDAFTKLCNKYAQGCCTSCCPGFISRPLNRSWVAWKYYRHVNDTINPYKLGKISTKEFLSKLKDIFYFLPDDQAEALLKEAWNAIIDFQESDQVKFRKLQEISQNEPVYLISNSNELNAKAIIKLLQDNFPDISWKENIDLTVHQSNQPIEIAPNIYLCLSYQYGLFKTDGLIKKVVEDQPYHQVSEVKVVSQFAPDREEALRLGVPAENISDAQTFYESSRLSIKVR